jgi:PHD/YefM family antitoxin component YafN of YafNO toxin-antitoxin module
MPKIRPITDLRDTNSISELCRKSNEPIFITKNGYGDLVIMSLETYERQLGIIEAYKKLAEAEKEIKDGVPLLEGKDVFKRLRDKYATI